MRFLVSFLVADNFLIYFIQIVIKSSIIKANNRTGTVEQMDANIEAMARDLQEILRLSAEQKRLWDVYEGREEKQRLK